MPLSRKPLEQRTEEHDVNSMNREDFKAALKSKKFGDFAAMYRPFWNTGGEMGNWDEELISFLPDSCRIFASAGAGFDWVDTKAMAKKGKSTRHALTASSHLHSLPRFATLCCSVKDVKLTEGTLILGIVYCNAAAACTESVADVAIYLIISAFRRQV